MFKIIWQVAFPLSVAFFATAAFDEHQILGLIGGILCVVVGVASYQLDKKEEQNASYKRLNYALKRFDAVLEKRLDSFQLTLAKTLKQGGNYE